MSSERGGRRRDWYDRASDRGARERAADRRRRRDMERTRATWDRDNPEATAEDAEVVVPSGPTVRPAPPVRQLDGVLAAIVEQRGWGERLRGADLEQRWAEVVGAPLAERCRPGRLAGGVLQVVVDSPQWATQLQWMAAQIAARAAEVVDAEVREVRVVVGEL